MQRRAGFTLIEVMIAIVILAVGMASLFTSEAGAVRIAQRARTTTIATLLARCKMGEIEEQVAAEGMPAIDDTGSDACCEGAEVDGFTCDWEIMPIVLPDNMFAPEEGAAGMGEEGSPPADPAQAAKDQVSAMDPTQVLSGGADTSGITSMALGFVFPILKPSFEQQIRRATVTVHWKEGSSDHSFDVTQYMVSDQAIAIDANAITGAAAQGAQGAQGTAPQPGTGTGP
jgi:general secretion pathway protein I